MKPTEIGEVDWTNDDLRASLEEFNNLYAQRPIENNRGGMKSSHLFPTWWLLKRMQPSEIIESGTFQGQGTFFMRKACPHTLILSIEPRPDQIIHREDGVAYTDIDFSYTEPLTKKLATHTIIHFDDHQNAVERIKQMKKRGFKYAMFEDNYPMGQGDCYSLKQAFGNEKDGAWLHKNLKVYYEFPPIFTMPNTRWHDAWSNYPTPDPLIVQGGEHYRNWMAVFVAEATSYTWICYVELK